MKKPSILLVNDDGFHAPGLKALWGALKDRADLYIVAPASEKSGAGLSISMYKPLHLQKVDWAEDTPAYSLSGTPADCVKIAIGQLMDSPPDFVFSGINKGVNHGRNVFYSGTVGGAIEGALRGVPAVALSCFECRNPDYTRVAALVPEILDFLVEHPLKAGTLLNINFPPSKLGPIRGIRLARQGQGFWRETPHERTHPEGHTYYWLGGEHAEYDEHAQSDVRLLQQGFVTAVPLNIGALTCTQTFDTHGEAFSSYFAKPIEAK